MTTPHHEDSSTHTRPPPQTDTIIDHMRFRRSLKTKFPIGGLGDHELHRRQIALAHDMATRLQYYTHQRQAPHQDIALHVHVAVSAHPQSCAYLASRECDDGDRSRGCHRPAGVIRPNPSRHSARPLSAMPAVRFAAQVRTKDPARLPAASANAALSISRAQQAQQRWCTQAAVPVAIVEGLTPWPAR